MPEITFGNNLQQNMASNRREELCRQIAALPPNCTEKEVRQELDHTFLAALGTTDLTIYDGISPLMVACDKANVECLKFLADKYVQSTDALVSRLIGKPLDQSKQEEGKNTAIHHAAMSGCVPSMRIFMQMGVSAQNLGQVANVHGDTPLQMAATAGHIHFVKAWYEIAKGKDYVSNDVRSILEKKNSSGDTCLSLACCHGQTQVLEFLLQTGCCTVSHEELNKCQRVVDRMDMAIQNIQDSPLSDEYNAQHQAVRRCLGMLQISLSQTVDQAAKDLLDAEDDGDNKASESQQNTKKKKKKKKKPVLKDSTAASAVNSESTQTTRTTPQDGGDNVQVLQITTLEGGKVAVRVSSGQAEIVKEDAAVIPKPAVLPKISVDDMFRQRFKGLPPMVDSEIDAVMDALCLDVSMLLYTPHGMALNLSPSQLDAVERILEKQMISVKEARQIQHRAHITTRK
jgi:ankyrin repeat protein